MHLVLVSSTHSTRTTISFVATRQITAG